MYNLEGLRPYVWPQHSKKESACDGLCAYLTCRSGKEFESSSGILCEHDALATFGYPSGHR
jgi:hypothetical protein